MQVVFWALTYFVYFLPFALAYLTWVFYLYYIREKYINDEPRILLEIKIPKEVTKSPKAMELFYEVMEQGYEGELIDRYIKGSIRGWFSMELVSIGGQIHFYFNIPKFFQNVIEARLYSQYPEVEISLVEQDYTKEVTFGQPGSPWDVKIWEYVLDEKDEALPIKTYIDYEMDRDPKEEFKIEPMTPMLEFLASVKPFERVWIQIMIMAAKKRVPMYNDKDKKTEMVTWNKKGKELVEKLSRRDTKESDLAKAWTKNVSTDAERDALKSVQRNLNKIPFDVGIRAVYASSQGLKPATGVGLNSSFKQYGSNNLNRFKAKIQTSYDNPWQDPWGWRAKRLQLRHFQYYCNRSYFYPPASKKPIGLSTEELATIYHFPSSTASTPTLGRIPSKRGEPPENLPI